MLAEWAWTFTSRKRAGYDAKAGREVFAVALGNGFEFFDFTVCATFLGSISQRLSPERRLRQQSCLGGDIRQRLYRATSSGALLDTKI